MILLCVGLNEYLLSLLVLITTFLNSYVSRFVHYRIHALSNLSLLSPLSTFNIIQQSCLTNNALPEELTSSIFQGLGFRNARWGSFHSWPCLQGSHASLEGAQLNHFSHIQLDTLAPSTLILTLIIQHIGYMHAHCLILQRLVILICCKNNLTSKS